MAAWWLDTDVNGAPEGAEVLDFGDATIMPGLVDAHIHLALDAGPDPLGRLSDVDDEQLLGEMQSAARQALMAGDTTVRDLGDRGFLGVRIKEMTSADPLLGADVVPAGPPLTSPQGHCWSLGGVVEESGIRAAVREHARSGADVIKVMVTGGEMTPGTDPTTCQFSLAALDAAADEAHRQGLMITGHAHGAAGILAAVEAGFDGSSTPASPQPRPHGRPRGHRAAGGQQHHRDRARRAQGGHRCPRARGRHIEMSQHVRRQMVAAGIRVIPGPDGGIGPFKPHDVLPQAVLKLSEVMSIRDILAASTSHARQACGLGSSKRRLVPGYDADVLVAPGDLEHVLGSIASPVAVFHQGQRHLGPYCRDLRAVQPPLEGRASSRSRDEAGMSPRLNQKVHDLLSGAP